MGMSVPDVNLSFSAVFDDFNNKIVNWVQKIIPFNIADVTSELSLCEIACIDAISFDRLSLVDIMSQGKFPKFSITISLIGQARTFQGKALDFTTMNLSTSSFLDLFKSSFKFDFCVVNANCGSGQVCNHSTWTCSSNCGAGYKNVALIGCVKKLFSAVPPTSASASASASAFSKPADVSPAIDYTVYSDAQEAQIDAKIAELESAAKAQAGGLQWFELEKVNIYNLKEHNAALVLHQQKMRGQAVQALGLKA